MWKRKQQLGEVSGAEGVGHLLARLRRFGQAVEVAAIISFWRSWLRSFSTWATAAWVDMGQASLPTT